MDDLAFDMYQDPEVAQIIRKLDTRKNEAVIRKLFSIFFLFFFQLGFLGSICKIVQHPSKATCSPNHLSMGVQMKKHKRTCV